MSKKLTGNGLWESSRMMLPQHKERIVEDNTKKSKHNKPVLHEDEWELIIQNVQISLNYTEEVVIEVFDHFENRSIRGIITSVSQHSKKIKIECESGFEWVDFDELISVDLVNGGVSL